jgi:predicted transcriptional regulator YheO
MDKNLLKKLNIFGEGIAKLLSPFAEVVIHDIKKDQILAIHNPLSKRRVGDASHIDLSEIETEDDYFGPYTKTNWDGRELKSITFIERNEKGKPILLQCINIDVSQFHTAQKSISLFLGLSNIAPRLESIFKENIYEHMNTFITAWMKSRGLTLAALTKSEKQKLIKDLEKNGAFEKKNAAEYIGRVLNISRASVYNYLKDT